MAALADLYTAEIRSNLRRFATWEPGSPLRLGDYGELHGARFVRLGHIGDPHLGVTIAERRDRTNSLVSYSSAGAVTTDFDAGASADVAALANAKLGLRIGFGRKNAVFFNAADVRYHSISDQAELERQLLDLLVRRAWNPRHLVVTELTGAGATTIVVSAGSCSEIVLDAAADVPRIDLADASLRLGVRSEREIGYKAITADGLTPLVALSRIRPRGMFWSRRHELTREIGFTASGRSATDDVHELVERLEDLGPDIVLDQVGAADESPHDAYCLAPVQP